MNCTQNLGQRVKVEKYLLNYYLKGDEKWVQTREKRSVKNSKSMQ